MARKLKADKLLFLATFLLVCSGLVMVYSASAPLAESKHAIAHLYLAKQAAFAALGFLLLYGLMHVDYRTYQQQSLLWTGVVVIGVALVAVLTTGARNGAHRWFAVAGITIQPSEFAKLLVIAFSAELLSRRMDRVNELKQVTLPLAMVIGAISALVFVEPDYGTALLLLFVTGVMIFAGGLSYGYLLTLLLTVGPTLGAFVYLDEERRNRVLAFLNPWDHASGDAYQSIQSMLAVASGGWFGVGLTQSIQKRFYIPEPHTDFIYAIISEELGLVGAALTVAAYVVIAWRGLRVASSVPDRFGAFLALGITTALTAQAFINIGVALSLLPPKGIALPFISAGGSSLLVSMAAMGVLLNVSQHSSSSV